jgi:acyl-CoA thioester hydrolase
MEDIATLPVAVQRHVHEFRIRFSDIDSQGHVNNCRFLTYLEDARLEMFHADPVRNGEPPVRGMVIARHEIDYRRPLMFDIEPLRVETWVTEAGAASFRLAYEVRDDEHVYATAASLIVAYDVEAVRPRRFTRQERDYIGRYLQQAP